MMPPEMKKQAGTIAQWLERFGWQVVEKEQPFEHEWWAYEIWAIESTWSPEGTRIYLTFWSDPDLDLRSLIATKERPNGSPHLAEPSMSLLRGWEREVPAFMEQLAKFREGD
jgi:hypothetical protein